LLYTMYWNFSAGKLSYQFSIEFIQYLPLRQGRRSPGLKVWDTEMIRKSCQNSVSLHFGTPEPDNHIFNGESVSLPGQPVCTEHQQHRQSEECICKRQFRKKKTRNWHENRIPHNTHFFML